MRNYTDDTQPQTVARYMGIQRSGKSGLSWNVQCLERLYANINPDDTDFFKDDNGFNFSIGLQDMATEFPLVDPSTLEPTTNTMTIGAAMNVIQSLYIFQARKRDEAAEQQV